MKIMTPKMYAVAREKRRHRESPAIRLKRDRKRERLKDRTITRKFILAQQGRMESE